MPTPQQASKQSFPLSNRSAHRAPLPVLVVGDHSLVALIDIPFNVSLMVTRDQSRPVFPPPPHLPPDPLLSGIEPHDRFAAPIHICSGVDRILQHAEHRVIS